MPASHKLNSQFNKDHILQAFPKLANDPSFKVDSPINPDYNCIAWAGKRWRVNWWPYKSDFKLDGASYEWPFGLLRDNTIKSFIALFEHLGYNLHPSTSTFESGFIKIALFAELDPSGKTPLLDRITSHAGRQLSSGLWTSKLGEGFDIIHSNPYDLESTEYGDLVYILKQKFS